MLSCSGSSVGRALMPREQKVVGSNPTQDSSFFFEKSVVAQLFAFVLTNLLDVHA